MDWLNIISTIGIPGAFCIALAWYVKLMTGNFREDVKHMQSEYSEELRQMLHTGGIPGNYVCGKIPGIDYSDEPVPEPGDAEDFRNYMMEHAPETIATLYEKWRKQNG